MNLKFWKQKKTKNLFPNQDCVSIQSFDGVDRFEVIDDNGMAYQMLGGRVKISFQDRGRTLKVFIENPSDESRYKVRQRMKKSLEEDFADRLLY